nr:hypothetical protein PanWU01x14_171450 [Ipomoea batatas]
MALIRAATAETCGQDIEVPDIMLYFTTRRSNDNFVGDDASLHAANMLSPGAGGERSHDRGGLGSDKRLPRKKSCRGIVIGTRGKHSIATAGPHRDDPRRHITHSGRRRPGISGTARHHNVALHRVQRADGYTTACVILRSGCGAQGDADDIHAVGDRVVERRENVVVQARQCALVGN